jgi:hypothetical protein
MLVNTSTLSQSRGPLLQLRPLLPPLDSKLSQLRANPPVPRHHHLVFLLSSLYDGSPGVLVDLELPEELLCLDAEHVGSLADALHTRSVVVLLTVLQVLDDVLLSDQITRPEQRDPEGLDLGLLHVLLG